MCANCALRIKNVSLVYACTIVHTILGLGLMYIIMFVCLDVHVYYACMRANECVCVHGCIMHTCTCLLI